MSSELSHLESTLQRLRPAPLDASLLARLEACANGAWCELSAEEAHVEAQLRQAIPAPVPPALLATLEASILNLPIPSDEKIIRFPRHTMAPNRKRHSWWGAAAAAVALIGAATALLIPEKSAPASQQAQAPRVARPSLPSTAAPQLIPAGFNRGLAETRDEGVIWQSNAQPQRVLKVVYMDRVTLKDAGGRTYQVEQPRVEYILVPAKTD